MYNNDGINVLVIDDDPLVLQLAEVILRNVGYEVHCVSGGAEAVDHVRECPPDIVLSDHFMPGETGIEVCRRIASAPLDRPIYTILMSSNHDSDHEFQADSLFAGADDFLAKPFTRKSLVAHVHSGARVVMRERRLHLASRVDPTTGLANRRAFDEVLEREWSRWKRYERPLGCMVVDIDQFKTINDDHGHPMGDAVLKAVGETIVRTCRTSEFVCRYGGDEFVILLPETPRDRARICANRVVEAVRSVEVVHRGETIRTSVSIGVSDAGPSMKTSLDLVEAADADLRLAKQWGRDRVGGLVESVAVEV